MRATGLVRKIDQLGRLVVPNQLRRELGIGRGDPVEIFVDSDNIVLAKYEPKCVFCGAVAEWMFRERPVCEACREELKARNENELRPAHLRAFSIPDRLFDPRHPLEWHLDGGALRACEGTASNPSRTAHLQGTCHRACS